MSPYHWSALCHNIHPTPSSGVNIFFPHLFHSMSLCSLRRMYSCNQKVHVCIHHDHYKRTGYNNLDNKERQESSQYQISKR